MDGYWCKEKFDGCGFFEKWCSVARAISLRITFSLLIYITNSRTKYELIVDLIT